MSLKDYMTSMWALTLVSVTALIVLIDIHALKYFLLVDFTPSLFKVMEMIKSQAKNLFYIHCKKILKWSCSIHGDPDGHVAIYA